MKRSTERILTTHTGSLPRPDDLIRTMFAREEGVPVDPSALFGLLCVAALFLGATCWPAAARAAADDEPVRLHQGPHLLLDDYLWAEKAGASRRVNAPRRSLSAPVVTGPEDKNFQPYMTVLREPDTGAV